MGAKNVMSFFRDIYNNEYQWSLVKSIGFFVVGVKVAQECVGFEIMPALPR